MAGGLISYDAEDIEAARRKQKIFTICFIVLSVIVVAGLAVLFALRQQVATIALSIVGGGAMIFVWDAAGTPVLSYSRFLRDQRRGLTHTYNGKFAAWGDLRVRDGVPCRELTLEVDGEALQFFLDLKKAQPALEEGQAVEIVTHNKAVISMR